MTSEILIVGIPVSIDISESIMRGAGRLVIITSAPREQPQPQHMKCATSLWKTKLQLFDSLVLDVFTMTAGLTRQELPHIPPIPHISY